MAAVERPRRPGHRARRDAAGLPQLRRGRGGPRRRSRRCSASIADGRGPATLFHCTAGKDRTGWAAALLLHLAGVDDATILEDYLLTNTFSRDPREVPRPGPRAPRRGEGRRLRAGDGGRRGLPAGRVRRRGRGVRRRHGYLRDGLGLDDATLDALRDRMLG